MATNITEILTQLQQHETAVNTKNVMSYYERVSQLVKRTHIAMGRSANKTTHTIATTTNGKLNCILKSSTY